MLSFKKLIPLILATTCCFGLNKKEFLQFYDVYFDDVNFAVNGTPPTHGSSAHKLLPLTPPLQMRNLHESGLFFGII